MIYLKKYEEKTNNDFDQWITFDEDASDRTWKLNEILSRLFDNVENVSDSFIYTKNDNNILKIYFEIVTNGSIRFIQSEIDKINKVIELFNLTIDDIVFDTGDHYITFPMDDFREGGKWSFILENEEIGLL